MTRAFEAVFGVPGALEGVPVAGRTDPAILSDAVARTRVSATDGERQRFQEVYLPILADEMSKPAPAHAPRKGRSPACPNSFTPFRHATTCFSRC